MRAREEGDEKDQEMRLYERGLRPLLFQLPADRAHDLAQLGFRWSLPWKLLNRSDSAGHEMLATDMAGLRLENPFGLAPGFDKNGLLVPSLDHLGFGYLVVGSVTRHPRPGNPRPRLVRYPDRSSLGNNLGLPSLGLDQVLRVLRSLPRPKAKLIVSVTGFTAEELLEAARAVEPYVDAVELGLVCPNTTESERMAEMRTFTKVAEGIARQRRKPVFVRLPPHHDEAEWERASSILDTCMRVGLEGVSTNGRRRVADPSLPGGGGSISGRATFDDALRIVDDVARHTNGAMVIRASGGVFGGENAAKMIQAGATTVEVYSSLIYRGPRIARLLAEELTELLHQRGFPSVDALRPSAKRIQGREPDHD